MTFGEAFAVYSVDFFKELAAFLIAEPVLVFVVLGILLSIVSVIRKLVSV